MVILRLDEPGLFVYNELDNVPRDIEAIDIEESLQFAYDETGRRLDVEWIVPNSRSRFLFLRSSVNGRYRLVPSDVYEPRILVKLLVESPYFDPPNFEEELRALGRRLLGSEN